MEKQFNVNSENLLPSIIQNIPDLKIEKSVSYRVEKNGYSFLVIPLFDADTFLNSDIKLSEFAKETHKSDSINVKEELSVFYYRNGENWVIGQKGETRSFKSMKGLSFLHYLLQNPGKECSCIDIFHKGDFPVLKEKYKKHDECEMGAIRNIKT